MADFKQLINRLQVVRDYIVDAINDKGGHAEPDMSFAELSNQIYAMPTGIEHVRSGYQLFMNNTEMTELPAGLDVERLGSLYKMCYGCTALTYVGELRTANITDLRWVFYGCSSLVNIDGIDTDSITSATEMFHGCISLVTIHNDLDFSNVTEKIDDTFTSCKALQNVSFKGTINVDIAMNGCQKLTVASLLSLLNALAPGANKTCKIGTTNITKLTEEQRMIAINKGWQLV